LPKVSVIIPCYNDGAYINDAVFSVLAQTCQDFEIIIVNDGSTDEFTNQLLAQYNMPKTKVIVTANVGPSMARNIGIAKATGVYILPLDADDKIAPTYIEKGIQVFESNSSLGIVYCEAEFFGNRQGKWHLPQFSLEAILLENMIFCTAFFKKADWEKVGGFNANMIHGMEDYDFWLSLIELEVGVHQIPETLFFYRIKDQSRTVGLQRFNTEMFVQLFYNHQDLYVRNIRVLIAGKFLPSYVSKLFIDSGNGFNAKESIAITAEMVNNNFEYTFDVSNCGFFQSIRFDPIEGHCCRAKINKIIYSNQANKSCEIDITAIHCNGVKQQDGYYLFETIDPMFFLPITGRINSCTISGNIELVNMWDILEQKKIIIEQYERTMRAIYQSKAWKIGNIIKKIYYLLTPFKNRGNI
jgi:glycosyltransferase involved in cell wall biosynthesis